MKLNNQLVIYLVALVVALACFSSAASVSGSSNSHLKVKRSPYLRLDELSTKIYLAKNKLGGGMIDPLEIGKRSPSSSSSQNDDQIDLAVVLYDGIQECVSHSGCSRALKILLDN